MTDNSERNPVEMAHRIRRYRQCHEQAEDRPACRTTIYWVSGVTFNMCLHSLHNNLQLLFSIKSHNTRDGHYSSKDSTWDTSAFHIRILGINSHFRFCSKSLLVHKYLGPSHPHGRSGQAIVKWTNKSKIPFSLSLSLSPSLPSSLLPSLSLSFCHATK